MVDEDALPLGWASATLPELVPHDGIFVDGDWVESKDQDAEGDVRLIQLADVGDGTYRDRSARFLTHATALRLNCTFLQSGDLLVARMPEPLGRACIFPGADRSSVTVVDVCVIRLGADGVSNRWLVQAINAPQFRSAVATLQSGTTRQRISRTNLAIIELPVPPLAEQHRIVAAIEQQFTRLDAGVAALRRVRAALKRYRAAVLKAAVEGRLTEAWRAAHPDTEPAAALLARILAERRARWEADLRAKGKDPAKVRYAEPAAPDTANLPALPEGWCWATVEQLAEVVGGVTKGRDLTGRSIVAMPYLRVANVQRGFLDLSEMKTIEVPEEEVARYLLRDGDVVMTEGGDADKLGRAALWRNQISECIHQNHIFRVRLIASEMQPQWLMDYANSELGRAYFLNAAKQTVNLASINMTQLRLCPLPLPPVAEQVEIVAEVERRLSVVSEVEAAIEANLTRAERLRQSILERAFSGRLVPQDPNDEPASALLERIRREREHAAANGSARRNGRNGGDGRESAGAAGEAEPVAARQARLWDER